MSFDIFFQPCRFHGPPVEVKNPFTGKVQSVLQTEPLSSAELKAVRAVLSKENAAGPDEFGCYVVAFDDGVSVEVDGSNLSEGCTVCVREATPYLFEFLIELLKAGNWAMLPTMAEAMTIAASAQTCKDIPERFPKRIVCDTAEALEILLKDGLRGWQEFRNNSVDDDQ